MSKTSIRDALRRSVARGQPPCHICGQDIDYSLKYPHPQSFVIDHVEPESKGGANARHNVMPAHASCNRAKSDKEHAPIIRRSGSIQRPPGGF